MDYTKGYWTSTESIYEAIRKHPFNVELGQGNLSADRFSYYVQQDSLYLRDYARALAMLAAKAPVSDEAADLMKYAQEGIAVEQALHGHFFSLFNIKPYEIQEPACFSYTRFLLSSVSMGSYAVGLAAVLPCFWVYREVGLAIAESATTASNPYMPWIETYSDESFAAAVDRMLKITNRVAVAASADEQKDMETAFMHSIRHEWMFWDAAYRLERWPL